MNIVYCVYQCEKLSGGIRVIFEQANRLSRRGHNVEIWTIEPFSGFSSFPLHVPVVQIPCEYDYENQKVIKLYPRKTKALKPDVYIAASHPTAYGHESVPDAKAFWYLQHEESITFIDIAKPEKIKVAYEEALKLPLTLICNSKWTRSEIKKKYGVDAKVIVCGIDEDIFSPAEPLIVKDESPSIVACYNELTWKGMADLFEALNIVFGEIPDLKLFLISALAPQALISKRPVTIFLAPSQDEIKRIYSSATIFVSSSWAEGFGLPGLEAMACGVPVVTTNSGGVMEYAENNETALVVAPQNPEALARSILEILSNRSLRERLAKNGIKKAEEFSWDGIINELEDVLR